MNSELMNLFLFIGICLVLYLSFRNFNYNNQYSLIEGMTDTSVIDKTLIDRGIAGNAASYSAQIKADTIKLQDIFLISKYKTEYENVILNLDDFMNNLMLKTVLSFDTGNPGTALSKLAELQQAKAALIGVMKFVDSQ
jgi:hypothetical protein